MEVSNPVLEPAHQEETPAPLDPKALRLVLHSNHPAARPAAAVGIAVYSVAASAWFVGTFRALHPGFGPIGWFLAGLL